MDEQMTSQSMSGPASHAIDEPIPQATGHPAVDAVLESLSGLDDRPVEEHVAVFEAAHEQLRAALAGAHDSTPNRP